MKIYYVMKRNSIGGDAGKADWIKAFTDRKVCKAECLAKEEEFTSYDLIHFAGEEISDDRLIVDNVVLPLDRREWEEYARNKALEKLTPEEKQLLKLVPTKKTK